VSPKYVGADLGNWIFMRQQEWERLGGKDLISILSPGFKASVRWTKYSSPEIQEFIWLTSGSDLTLSQPDRSRS